MADIANYIIHSIKKSYWFIVDHARTSMLYSVNLECNFWHTLLALCMLYITGMFGLYSFTLYCSSSNDSIR